MTDTFQELRNLVKGVILTPGDDGYQESLKRWSHAAIKPAAVVVQPDNAEEVSKTLGYATAHKIPLAVVSGGHATSGSSSSDGGMVIDLRRINSVVVDAAQQTVTFGGGCRWSQIDEACAEHGLATVSGTVNHTGVGGFILGGGMGWLTPKHGLSIDNLVGAEVVLADGRIVTASEQHNQDLFWALRGAGQNFGVVTSFTLRAYPQGRVYAGPVIFTLDKIPAVVSFTNWFHANNTGNEAFWCGVCGSAPGTAGPVILCMVFKNGTQQEGEAFYKPLLDIGPVHVMAAEMPYPKANDLVPRADDRVRRLQGGANFVMPLDAEFVQSVADEFVAFVDGKGIGDGSMCMFECLPYQKVISVPRDATAYPSRGRFYHFASLFMWQHERLDGDVRRFQRELLGKLRQRGYQGNGGQYANYDGERIDPTLAFGENLDRLRVLKKKYDPDNVFYKWHSLWSGSS
ncbi:hypothetical protein ED733_004489 [Metarhizium rileyi]|uniref:FAD-binding PCMH-type domain-containing protein n=1 Tax=Metarhizium rileyi (strain RCEF 4871) TaxID=1649241 RepID=A0A5C6G5N8_METRR|nr:hypothetical protein ED733_004489 [Metarhizium rileyi]